MSFVVLDTDVASASIRGRLVFRTMATGTVEALHHIRDVTYREDHSQVRTGNGPQVMATIGNLAIAAMKLTGAAGIAATTRHYARNATTAPDHPRAHSGMPRPWDGPRTALVRT